MSTGNIRVLSRFRPFNSTELKQKSPCLVSISPDQRSVSISSPSFTCSLDRIFPENASQETVYEVAGEPVIEAVFEGFNGTILTYGQTGSGKTFTMMGVLDDPALKGIIPRLFSSIFSRIEATSELLEFTLKVSYCEIYMERLKDLLDPMKVNLKVHEDRSRGVFIANLTEQYVTNEDEMYELMKMGVANREVGATLMNEGSSRSHAMVIVVMTQTNTVDFSVKTSKLYLVDLAGSEKVSKTGAEGRRLDEAKLINKSLSTLGLVIFSLTDPKATHIPYRDSKLTRVLQDSIGGNAKTTLITTCSPAAYNIEETISTLRFGVRAKAVQNQPKVNKEPTIAELKMMLMKMEMEGGRKDRRIEALERLLFDHGIDPETPSLRLPTQEEPEGEDKDLENQLEDMQTRLSEELIISSSLRQDLQESNERALLFEHDLITKTTKIEELTLEIQKIREEMMEKDDNLVEIGKINANLEAELTKVMGEKRELEGKIEALMEESERTASENAHTSRLGSFLRAHPRLTEEIELKDAQIRELSLKLEAKEVLLAQIRDKTSDKTVNLLIRNWERDRGETMENTKEMLRKASEQVKSLEEALKRSRSENERLLKGKVPSLEEIKRELYSQAERKAREEWEEERLQLALDLQNRVEKVIRLEIEIDEAHESYRTLEESVRGGDSAMALKVAALEKTLDSLNANYHNLLSQGSHLRVANEVLSKRITRKSERIKVLESSLSLTQSHLKTVESQLEAVTAELNEVRSRGGNRSITSFASTRVVKPLKGGVKDTVWTDRHEEEDI